MECRSQAYKRLKLEKETNLCALKKPKKLPLSELHLEPLVFQQRDLGHGDDNSGTIEQHIDNLLRNIKHEADNRLDPITIWSTGMRWVIIDGHHRLGAYKLFSEEKGKAERAFKVPVQVFEGTLEEAYDHSAMANKKVSVALTRIQKSDASWRIVCTDTDGNGGWVRSKAQRASMGFVNSSTIGRMRSTYNKLLKTHWVKNIDPMDMSWIEAQERSQGKKEPREYSFDAQDRLSDDWASRLGRDFGVALIANPEAFLMALGKYSPQLLEGIREMIKEDSPYGFDCDDIDDQEDPEGDF